MSQPRVAVIGCGPSGMAVLSAFSKAEAKGETIPEITCFEKQDAIGGLWNYSWRKGTDQYGEYVHNSMYRGLFTNGPRECLEMADYTFHEHFGKELPSFPPRAVLYDYLMGRAKKFNITKYDIRCSTVVRHVEEKGEQFLVTSTNLKTQQTSHGIFDYVIVATGHFSVPNLPTYPGIENFGGHAMHSHDFRNAAEYKGKTVLVIGSGFSGEDIALQSYKYGAESVIISHHLKPTGFKWPDKIREVPQLLKFEDGAFHFKDGTSFGADVLIFCTGYLNHYPFLPDNLRIERSISLYQDHLYKGIVCENNRRLLYMAPQNQYFTYTMFDVQAHWSRDYILGKIDPKTQAARSEDIKLWRQRFLEMKDMNDQISFQGAYVRDLMNQTDYLEHGLEERVEMWKRWKIMREEDILTYRDKGFTSTISKVKSPRLKVEWINAFDDSLDFFTNAIEPRD